MTTTTAHAAEFVATEVAWNGSASESWIAARVASAGLAIDVAAVVAYAVEVGLLRPIPRLGGFTVGCKVNARVFGEGFAEWIAA
jgi:hypothetical protein